MACKSMISTMTVTTDHALRASHLMLGLVHQDLEVLIPLGVQIVVDDLAPRPVRLPHSHSAHAHIRTSKTQFTTIAQKKAYEMKNEMFGTHKAQSIPWTHGRIWKTSSHDWIWEDSSKLEG